MSYTMGRCFRPNGRTLALSPDEDFFRKLTEQELYEERVANGTLTESDKIRLLREEYPSGCRIEYLGVNDFLTTIPSGTKGTVEGVDRHGNILMKWDIKYKPPECFKV